MARSLGLRRRRRLLPLPLSLGPRHGRADESEEPRPEPHGAAGAHGGPADQPPQDPPAEAQPPEEPTPGPPEPPPMPASPPAPAPAPKHQKLTLYVGAGVIVVAVIVIIAVASRVRRRPLDYVPYGENEVDVVPMERFLQSALYQTIRSAEHPLEDGLVEFEFDYNIRLRRDITYAVDTARATVLIGDFRPERLREAYEAGVAQYGKNLRPPAELEIRSDAVEGRPFLYVDQEGVDYAFATVGSSVVCFGSSAGVRRVLRVRAEMHDSAATDENFEAAFSPELARSAVFYRLEKPGEAILAEPRVQALLGEAGEAVRAAFYAVTSSEESVGLTVHLLARDGEAAQKLEAALASEQGGEALCRLVGCPQPPAVSRSEALVALEAQVPMARWEEIVEADKRAIARGEPRTNLFFLLFDQAYSFRLAGR
ncbi:MAG: hypothetical protein ACLF0G_10930 [Candidatus Brocadiia bacterium]